MPYLDSSTISSEPVRMTDGCLLRKSCAIIQLHLIRTMGMISAACNFPTKANNAAAAPLPWLFVLGRI